MSLPKQIKVDTGGYGIPWNNRVYRKWRRVTGIQCIPDLLPHQIDVN